MSNSKAIGVAYADPEFESLSVTGSTVLNDLEITGTFSSSVSDIANLTSDTITVGTLSADNAEVDDMTIVNTINIGFNETWAKEVNHTSTVTTSTTAATAGGNLSHAAGAGATTGVGGDYSARGGAGGNDAVGGDASLVGGAAGGGNRSGGIAKLTGGAGAGSAAGGNTQTTGGAGGATGAGGVSSVTGGAGGATSGAGGAVSLAGGAATAGNSAGGQAGVTGGLGRGTAAGGAIVNTSGASSNGAGVSPGASGAITNQIGTPGTATTGTAGSGGTYSDLGANGAASTGAGSVAGNGSTMIRTGGNGGNSSGGGDTAGNGGNIIDTAGNPGTGATTGKPGLHFLRSTVSKRKQVTAMTTTATIASQAIGGGLITANQGAAGTATYTMPQGSVFASALPPQFTTGDSLEFSIVNISTNAAEDVTVAGDTGMVAKGNMFIPSNAATSDVSFATFCIVCTGTNTFDFYRIG